MFGMNYYILVHVYVIYALHDCKVLLVVYVLKITFCCYYYDSQYFSISNMICIQ